MVGAAKGGRAKTEGRERREGGRTGAAAMGMAELEGEQQSQEV